MVGIPDIFSGDHPEELRAWLKTHVPEVELLGAPEPLTGGLLNHVWKIPASPAPIVVKWSPPHIASAPEIALAPSRSGFEARALASFVHVPELAAILSPSSTAAAMTPVHVPALLAAIEDPWVIAIPWIDARGDLSETSTSRGFEADARALGAFIARLHTASAANPELMTSLNNIEVQRTRAEVQYNALAAWLDEHERGDGRGASPQRRDAAARLRALGQRFLKPGRCLIMGDLWPRSILVSARDTLVIIDWEFAHFGHPAQDVGHLCAHLWLAWCREPSERWPAQIEAFVTSYREHAPELARDDALWSTASEHFGAEILARTVGAFADPTFTDEMIARAVEVASSAITESDDGFSSSNFSEHFFVL